MRAFLAIPVLSPALEDFEALRERIVAEVPAVRWAPAGSPHITLHFFGAVSADQAERALGVLRPVIAAHPAMTLRLHGLGSFPPRGNPRVLWCGVDDESGTLNQCALACRDALDKAAFQTEERPYRAHCTLGRPRLPWPDDARESWRRLAHEQPCTPSFIADRAVLYKSLTGSAGVSHVPRDVLPLHAA